MTKQSHVILLDFCHLSARFTFSGCTVVDKEDKEDKVDKEDKENKEDKEDSAMGPKKIYHASFYDI